jgi:hypothetical protein
VRCAARRAGQCLRPERRNVVPENPRDGILRRPRIEGMSGSWDFIYDWTLKGGAFRVLSVVDE